MSSIHQIETALAALSTFINSFLQQHPTLAHWRRSNNNQPDFTDTDVLCIALMQGCLGCSTLKQTYLYIRHNQSQAFPHLVSYARFMARLHSLQPLVGFLVEATANQAAGRAACYVIDSKPIPVCKPPRTGRVRLLREEGAAWGKGSTGWYFGFKLHLLEAIEGGIFSVMLTPANVSDLDPDVLHTLCSHLSGGLLLGDAAYQSRALQQELADTYDMELRVASDYDARTERGRIHRLRKHIETTLSQLWRQMLDRVFSRSFLGLWNTLLLKILFHNLKIAHILG